MLPMFAAAMLPYYAYGIRHTPLSLFSLLLIADAYILPPYYLRCCFDVAADMRCRHYAFAGAIA